VSIELDLPPSLSYSQANSISTCGWRYALERLIGVPSQPSWAAVAGNGVHTATEWWDEWTVAGEWVKDRAVIEKLFNDAFDKHIAERLEHQPEFPTSTWRASGRASKQWPNKEDEAWWRANGPAQVMSWVTWRTNNSQWELAPVGDSNGIEIAVKAELGGVVVRGYIDRLFHRGGVDLLCVDLKSGARVPDSTDQLGTYKRLLEETYDVTPSHGCYWMSRTGGTTEMVDLSVYTKERVDYTYAATRKMQTEGLFLPKQSNMCSGCSVRDACFAVGGKDSDLYPTPWEVTTKLPASSV